MIKRSVSLAIASLIAAPIFLSVSPANAAPPTEREQSKMVDYVRKHAPSISQRFSDADIVAMGRKACKVYRLGFPEDTVAETIERKWLDHNVRFNFTARVMQGAQIFFCQRYL